MGVTDWSRTPDANAFADPLIEANDGTSARAFSRSLRGAMAGMRKLSDDQGGALVSTGSADVFVVHTFTGLSELRAGISLSFIPHRDNTGPSSLSVDGHGALPLLNRDGVDLDPGHIRAQRLVRVVYDAASPSWRTVDLGSIANTDFADTPALTFKANAGDGLADIPVPDARALLHLDRVTNKSEAELVASGPIAEALAGTASAGDIAAAVEPIPGLIQTAVAPIPGLIQAAVAPFPGQIQNAHDDAIATVVGGAPSTANTLGKVNTLLTDKASVAQTTSLQSALIIIATSFIDGSARQIRTYTGH